ncbi:MAG TPA: glycosyltransferase family 1 protein [Candidatus Saccharimonadia bacterium]|jgi:glycosyltransferase involved in cell wall biosynthesis
MKIAIDARIIYTSTGRYVERLLEHLQQLDQKNEYIVLLLAKDFDRWQPSAPNFRKVVADFPIYSLGEQLGLARLMYGLKADLVHFTMPQHPLLYWRRHVVTVHDLTLLDFVIARGSEGWLQDFFRTKVKPAAFKLTIWWTARWAQLILVPTRYVSEQMTRRLGARNSRVIVTYEAADPLATKAEKPEIGQGREFLLYVGNAYPYKNLWRLIEAHRGLHHEGLKLVLVGKRDYFYEQLERRAKQQGMNDVIFAGFVPDEQLRWLYEHAKLYVFPSLSEGFGLPPLEAMQYGLPVVSSRATCLPEVYQDAAEYFDPQNTEDMVKVIEKVLEDRGQQEKLRRAGYERVKQFSWQKMAEQTFEAYRQAG